MRQKDEPAHGILLGREKLDTAQVPPTVPPVGVLRSACSGLARARSLAAHRVQMKQLLVRLGFGDADAGAFAGEFIAAEACDESPAACAATS